MQQKGKPKTSKGKEGVVVKRDRELKYKEELFRKTLEKLEDENSDENIVTDSE